jgi:hypothetical protein
VGIDTGTDVDALHGWPVLRIVQDLFAGNDASFQDVLVVIGIMQKALQRGDALYQARLQLGPLGGIDKPRNDVERDQPFLDCVVAIHGKGDTHPLENQLGFLPFSGRPDGAAEAPARTARPMR